MSGVVLQRLTKSGSYRSRVTCWGRYVGAGKTLEGYRDWRVDVDDSVDKCNFKLDVRWHLLLLVHERERMGHNCASGFLLN